MSTELVTSFYCRNTKSSQEVVDFVGQKLREGVREREMQSLGALLETVCEEVSWGGAAKMAGEALFPPFRWFHCNTFSWAKFTMCCCIALSHRATLWGCYLEMDSIIAARQSAMGQYYML